MPRLIGEEDCPSRCVECASRMLKVHHVVMDTFEQGHACGFQCVACGLVMDAQKVGSARRIVACRRERVVLAPGELRDLRKDSAARTRGTACREEARSDDE